MDKQKKILGKLIREFLLAHNLMYTIDTDTGEGYPLVDALSPKSTIKEGKLEIESIVDELVPEILNALSESEPCPDCNQVPMLICGCDYGGTRKTDNEITKRKIEEYIVKNEVIGNTLRLLSNVIDWLDSDETITVKEDK